MRNVRIYSIILIWALCNSRILNAQSGSGDGICPTQINALVQMNDALFTLFPAPLDDTEILWSFGNDVQILDDDTIEYLFEEGVYLITASFTDVDCSPTEVTVLTTEITSLPCGIELTYVEGEDGLFTFTATGFPEEYPMYWSMGDGTFIVETWVVDYVYEPGVFEVCAWYTSDFCLDTVEACTVLEYVLPLNAQFNYSVDEGPGLVTFYAPFNAKGTTYHWDFGNDITSDVVNPLQLMQCGVYEVCLTVMNEMDSITFCQQVLVTEPDWRIFEITLTGFYSQSNVSDEIWMAPYDWCLDRSWASAVLDSVNDMMTSHFCYNGCFTFEYYTPDGIFEADSLHLQIYWLNTDSLVLDVFFDPNDGMNNLYWSVVLDEYCCTYVENKYTIPGIEVYPNPASNYINLKIPEDIGSYHLKMMDMTGRVVMNQRGFESSQNIRCSQFNDGLYLIELVGDGASFYTKVEIRK